MKADYFVIMGGDGLASCPLDMWRTLMGQEAVGVPCVCKSHGFHHTALPIVPTAVVTENG